MEICANCEQVQGHFLEPKTGHPVCSKLCAQELVDAFYGMQPYREVNPDNYQEMAEDIVVGGSVLYQQDGIKIDLYEKGIMSPEETEMVETLIFDVYSNGNYCSPVGRQYLPYVLLKEKLKYIVLAYASSEYLNYKKAVVGILLASRIDENSVMIDLVCSPKVKTPDDDGTAVGEDVIELKAGAVMVQRFVDYIFDYEMDVEEIALTALTTKLISYYANFGFNMFPAFQDKYEGHLQVNANQTKVFHTKYNPNLSKTIKTVEWDTYVNEQSFDNWLISYKQRFRNYLRRFLPEFRSNKEADIGNLLPKDMLEMSYIKDQGFLMRITSMEHANMPRRNRLIAPLTRWDWDRMIIEVDEEFSKKCHYLYVKLQERMPLYKRVGVPYKDILDLIEQIFIPQDVKRTNTENLDQRITNWENRKFGDGWENKKYKKPKEGE